MFTRGWCNPDFKQAEDNLHQFRSKEENVPKHWTPFHSLRKLGNSHKIWYLHWLLSNMNFMQADVAKQSIIHSERMSLILCLVYSQWHHKKWTNNNKKAKFSLLYKITQNKIWHILKEFQRDWLKPREESKLKKIFCKLWLF